MKYGNGFYPLLFTLRHERILTDFAYFRRHLVYLPTDGVIIGTTAAVLDPYLVDHNVTRDGENRGMDFFAAVPDTIVPAPKTNDAEDEDDDDRGKRSSGNSFLSSGRGGGDGGSTSLASSNASSASAAGNSPRRSGPDRLSRLVRSLQFVDKFGNGFDLDLRCNGDRSARQALDVLESLRPEYEGRRRHRLTGLELVDREDVDRLRHAGVIANLQVKVIASSKHDSGNSWLQLSSDWGQPSDPIFRDLVNLVGEKRAANAIPIRDLHLSGAGRHVSRLFKKTLLTWNFSGARVTLSSDWDVNAKSPLIGIKNAVTRGRQAVDIQVAIKTSPTGQYCRIILNSFHSKFLNF